MFSGMHCTAAKWIPFTQHFHSRPVPQACFLELIWTDPSVLKEWFPEKLIFKVVFSPSSIICISDYCVSIPKHPVGLWSLSTACRNNPTFITFCSSYYHVQAMLIKILVQIIAKCVKWEIVPEVSPRKVSFRSLLVLLLHLTFWCFSVR